MPLKDRFDQGQQFGSIRVERVDFKFTFARNQFQSRMDKTQIPTGITVRDFIITDKQRSFVGVNVLVYFVQGLFVIQGCHRFFDIHPSGSGEAGAGHEELLSS